METIRGKIDGDAALLNITGASSSPSSSLVLSVIWWPAVRRISRRRRSTPFTRPSVLRSRATGAIFGKSMRLLLCFIQHEQVSEQKDSHDGLQSRTPPTMQPWWPGWKADHVCLSCKQNCSKSLPSPGGDMVVNASKLFILASVVCFAIALLVAVAKVFTVADELGRWWPPQSLLGLQSLGRP